MNSSERATPAPRSASSGEGRPAHKSARRRSRELAVQGLYQWLLSREDVGAIEAHLAATSPGFERADAPHFTDLLNGAIRAADALHAQFAAHLDRPVEELSPVEHATLLLGTYELGHHLEIPYRVVINEAVEVAKTFGGTDGYKYINGVLDKVAAQIRAAEFKPR